MVNQTRNNKNTKPTAPLADPKKFVFDGGGVYCTW